MSQRQQERTLVTYSSLARILGECSTIHSSLALLKVEISSRTLIPLFRPGSVHSGSASLGDCGRMFSDELRVGSFPDRFPHYACTAAWSAHSATSLGQGCMRV